MRRVLVKVQLTCALGTVVLASPLAVCLPASLWRNCNRLRRYAFYGGTLTGVGLAMMYITVAHLSLNKFLAQVLVVPTIMAIISYFVHRHKTFADRQVSKGSGGRFTVVRLTGMGVSKISFYILVGILGMQYLVASIVITSVLAWPTYKFNRDWAYKTPSLEMNQKIGMV